MGQMMELSLADTANARTAAFRKECRGLVADLKPKLKTPRAKKVSVGASEEAHALIKWWAKRSGIGVTEALDEIIAFAEPKWSEKQRREVERLREGI